MVVPVVAELLSEDIVVVESMVLLRLTLLPFSLSPVEEVPAAETDDGDRFAATVAVLIEDEVIEEDEVDDVLDEPYEIDELVLIKLYKIGSRR